jgi:hypothetical protein
MEKLGISDIPPYDQLQTIDMLILGLLGDFLRGTPPFTDLEVRHV